MFELKNKILLLCLCVYIFPLELAYGNSQNHIVIAEDDLSELKNVKLGLNKSLVIDLPIDAHDILVANPKVADAVTRTSKRIYLFGKKIGQTNIFIFDSNGNQIVSLDLLIERDIGGLQNTIRRLIPNSNVKAEMINDNMVLTGTVPTPQAAAMAVRLAQIFVRGGEQTQEQNSASTNAESILVLNGNDENERTSDIVNLLKIEGEDQVHLKVIVAEVQRSVIKQLGINTSLAHSKNGFNFAVTGGPTASLVPSSSNGVVSGFQDSVTSFMSLYRALELNGVMRTLAEPSLSAISGEKAHFRAGGTYYLPEEIGSNGEGLSARLKEVDYGISLTFTPVVLSQGRISLKVRTEVSEPTAQGVPALFDTINLFSLRRRLADTTVELPSGGSMVIAGLIQDDVRQAVNGQPWLKDVPFFGALFRSREFVQDESEVVVIVTPYLVRPVAKDELVRPDKNLQPVADSHAYFLGRINKIYGRRKGKIPPNKYVGNVGFILN